MDDRHEVATEGEEATGWNRRQLLQRFGIAGAAVAAGPTLLAACGGDNKSSSTATTAAGAATTGSGGAATTAAAGGATTAAAAAGDVGAQLKQALGLTAADNLGGGKDWKMGAVLALSGNGSFYGK